MDELIVELLQSSDEDRLAAAIDLIFVHISPYICTKVMTKFHVLQEQGLEPLVHDRFEEAIKRIFGAGHVQVANVDSLYAVLYTMCFNAAQSLNRDEKKRLRLALNHGESMAWSLQGQISDPLSIILTFEIVDCTVSILQEICKTPIEPAQVRMLAKLLAETFPDCPEPDRLRDHCGCGDRQFRNIRSFLNTTWRKRMGAKLGDDFAKLDLTLIPSSR